MKRLYIFLLLVTLVVLIPACTGIRYAGSEGDYEEQVTALQSRLLNDPNDFEALRDLGVIYARTEQYTRAREYLQDAYARRNDDPKILFYLGLTTEMLGQRQTALRLFEQYPNVPRSSPFRKLMQGRYAWLSRELAREEIRAQLAQEEALDTRETDERIVAVFPFNYRGEADQYAALGRGLSEMISIDLSNVRSLRVVERIRLQALLDEIALGQEAFIDPRTAPRSGRLLGAGSIIGGGIDVPDRRTIRIDAAIIQAEDASTIPVESQDGVLQRFYELEKQLVYRLIDQFGVELTPEERQQIESIPTENLQAFLAFSRGLLLEDDRNFRGAARQYKRALELDPGFGQASLRADAAEGLLSAGGTVPNVIETAMLAEPPELTTRDMMENRLRNLHSSIGTNILPGIDNRNPAQELELPDPPPPPDRRSAP